MRRIIAVMHARNLEFIRDRAALAWNLLFPFLLVIALAFAFSGDGRGHYKVGVVELPQTQTTQALRSFLNSRYIHFVTYDSRQKALDKVAHHQLDMLIDSRERITYWVNEASPKGYLVERILWGVLHSADASANTADTPSEAIGHDEVLAALNRGVVEGMPVGYAQWVLPGILGMNMMFSALYGVGYVLVRYRKNGVLKRLKATPLSALEFMAAQVASRLIIIITVTLVLFVGCVWLLNLTVEGAYLDLLLLTLLGIIALISLGVLITSVTRSEELAGGLVNLVSWPMMLLSGVWFSLEGAPELLQWVARCLPLTHWIEGARAIMIEGANLMDIAGNLWVLALMSLLFMGIGAWRFNWGE